MASDVAESASNPLAGLRLLPRYFRFVIGAVLAGCLVTLALSEFTVAANSRDAQLDAVAAHSQAEFQALQDRDRTVLRLRLAVLASTVISVALLILAIRLAIDQATAERRLRESAVQNALGMKDLIVSRTAELVELWSHLQSNTEKEKADLARNLHDELGGLLTAARMDLSWLQRASVDQEPAVLARLQQLADELTEAMDVKRRVVENLRPALLDHFGLPTALQNYFEEMCKKAGLAFTMSVPQEMPELSDELSIALFRVGQESLTNIVRHAQATGVHLDIGMDGDDVTVIITDDGVGIDRDMGAMQHSHGIRGMRHRIQSLGGSFNLQTGMGRGTQVHIRSPLRQPQAPARVAEASP